MKKNIYSNFEIYINGVYDNQEKQNNDAIMRSSAMKPQQTQQGPIARPKNNDKDKKDEE